MADSSVSIPLPEIEHFEEKIIAACARQLLTSVSSDEDGNEVRYRSTLGRKIEDAMVAAIKEQAEAAAPIVATEILERGVRRSNDYGDMSGDPVPLKTIVAEHVVKAMSNYGSRRGIVEEMVRKEVEGQLRGELAQTIADAKAPILEAVRKEAVSAIEKALGNALKGLAA